MKKNNFKVLAFLVFALLITGCGYNSTAVQDTASAAGSEPSEKTVTLALAQESNELTGIWGGWRKKRSILRKN